MKLINQPILNKEGQEYTPCTTHKTFDLKIYAALV